MLLQALAERATEAAWAPDAVDDESADVAVAAAAVLERGVRGTRTPRERISAAIDPRPLLPRRTERVVIRELATPRA